MLIMSPGVRVFVCVLAAPMCTLTRILQHKTLVHSFGELCVDFSAFVNLHRKTQVKLSICNIACQHFSNFVADKLRVSTRV